MGKLSAFGVSEVSAVSLRDVSRAIKLFKFFGVFLRGFHFPGWEDVSGSPPSLDLDEGKFEFTDPGILPRAAILALHCAYHCKLT